MELNIIAKFTFIRRFYPKRLTITFRLYIFISMCVPWESNPQPFALLTQCSTTEPHRNTWKTAHLTPLLKNRDPTIMDNYHPISKLSVLAKIVRLGGREESEDSIAGGKRAFY